MACRSMTEDSHNFDWEPDTDPHRSEKPDLDSDLQKLQLYRKVSLLIR
jgi:hypothetical protein